MSIEIEERRFGITRDGGPYPPILREDDNFETPSRSRRKSGTRRVVRLMIVRQRVAGTNPPSPRLFPLCGIARPMNNPDQDTLIRAVEDARRILGEYIEPGPRAAARTVEHLLAVLDRNDVVHALDRIKRRRVIRLVE